MASEQVTLFEQKMHMQMNMFDSLPNEILQTVLAKLDVHKLIAIRAVCRRWMVAIEDICREQQTLIIYGPTGYVFIDYLSERCNGLVDLGKNTIFRVKQTQYSHYNVKYEILLLKDFCIVLAKLFPQVKVLAFYSPLDISTDTIQNLSFLLNQWSSTLVTFIMQNDRYPPIEHGHSLSDHIDNLTALKQLYFGDADFIKQTTFARLQHCTFSTCDIPNVVPYLGSCCTSLYLSIFASLSDLAPFPKLNSGLVKGLTHLKLATKDPEVLPFVCTTFSALQMLSFYFGPLPKLTFNADMTDHLARLSNLSQLSFYYFKFDLHSLSQWHVTTLKSVRILSLKYLKVPTDDHQFDGDLFCQVLSSIFPNLQELTIFDPKMIFYDKISQHLNHFVNLRKHHIGL